VAVVDRLRDPDDAESVDFAAIESLRMKGAKVVCIASGTKLPDLPDDVLIFGYQPTTVRDHRGNVRWGFDYAPVAPGIELAIRSARDDRCVLVALGGHEDFIPLVTVCKALSLVEAVKTVQILISPVVGAPIPKNIRAGMHQVVVVRHNVANVLELIAESGLVIASYGNLVFEALAVGTPTCVVGQKRFQTELAERLAMLGLCINAGPAIAGRDPEISAAINRALDRRGALSRSGMSVVDGRGLQRIARAIAEAARS
jgi:spore coat polysaccharide biosynthesis predicted glycosyltransferase SpsG